MIIFNFFSEPAEVHVGQRFKVWVCSKVCLTADSPSVSRAQTYLTPTHYFVKGCVLSQALYTQTQTAWCKHAHTHTHTHSATCTHHLKRARTCPPLTQQALFAFDMPDPFPLFFHCFSLRRVVCNWLDWYTVHTPKVIDEWSGGVGAECRGFSCPDTSQLRNFNLQRLCEFKTARWGAV